MGQPIPITTPISTHFGVLAIQAVAVAAPGAGCVRLHWVIGKVAPPGMLARVDREAARRARRGGAVGVAGLWPWMAAMHASNPPSFPYAYMAILFSSLLEP